MIKISRLSLRNFKSFKRISIPIPDGFTAIVGPNGSGKSNIIDAICFVLGRSSAKSLRAERFSDLIFNGGKKGKPADKAEVTLYLDNSGMEIPSQPKEIKIYRSVDASGNSIYKLNGKRTTRSEILEILSAAKIQPDGHNIILQGDITRIIEMSPLERRAIIDEIAGIAEYDVKKSKALRELEKTSNNLSKTRAVLNEVKEQLQRLEKEKEDALRHEYLKREIRLAKGTVLYSRKLEAEEERDRLQKELKALGKRAQKLKKFIETLTIKLDIKKRELENINKEIIIKEETEQFSVFKNLEKLKNEIKYLQDKAYSLESDIKKLITEKERILSDIQAAKQQVSSFEKENEALIVEDNQISREIKKLRSRIEDQYKRISPEDEESERRRKRLEEVRIKLDEERAKLLELEKNYAILTERKAEKDRILRDLQDQLHLKKKKLLELDKFLSNTKKKIEQLELEIKQNYSKKLMLVEKDVELKSEIEKLNALLQLKLDEFAKLNARYQALEKISQKRLSFNKAIDAILRLRDEGKIKGVYGTISELGRVNQSYSKALEVAAGGGLTFIVVDDDETAEKCINYLKQNQIGRATFLPLNKIRVKKPNRKELEVAKKSYGFAVDLVEFDEKYREAFAYIFRNTVVVKDVKFARKEGLGEVRMVTLDGDLIEPSGVMSGGFYKPTGISFEEVDTTKREVEKLQDEIKKLGDKKRELTLREGEIRKEIEDLTLSLDNGRRDLENLSEKVKSVEEEKKDILNFLTAHEAEANELMRTLKEFSLKLKEEEDEIRRLGASIVNLEEQKKSIERELKDSSAEIVIKEIRKLEAKVQSLERTREEKRGQIRLNKSKIDEILGQRIVRLEEELQINEAERLEKESLLGDVQGRLGELNNSLRELKKEESKVINRIKGLKERRNQLVTGLKKIEEKVRALKEERSGIERKSELARIEEARVLTRLDGINEGLKDYEDLDIELLAPIDTVELEKEVVKMEYELTSLEPINMRAVEDYEVVKEKYDKIYSRVEKLEEEIEAIKKLMEEIDQRKKDIFMETFENIAMNFRRIFSQLSDGGSADLLLDEDNPLEGGLMIKAKPVGKNPQYIELMSGGEKTITALSFIFAIQRYQPAPFYILDEIDMFLDDDNIRKVSELIKNSSKEAQFIVVSLREHLMTSASQLFGVSIEEGVSKIVGVELEEVAD